MRSENVDRSFLEERARAIGEGVKKRVWREIQRLTKLGLPFYTLDNGRVIDRKTRQVAERNEPSQISAEWSATDRFWRESRCLLGVFQGVNRTKRQCNAAVAPAQRIQKYPIFTQKTAFSASQGRFLALTYCSTRRKSQVQALYLPL